MIKPTSGKQAIRVTVVIALSGAVAQAEQKPLVHEGVIDAPIAAVWRAFTTKEGLESWMVPHADIDLRVGGKMRTNYDPEGRIGDENTIENTILSFEPERMLSIKATKPPASFPYKNAIKDTWSVMYFDELREDQTRLRIAGLGYGESDEAQQMRAFFQQGNAWTLDRLRTHFAGADDANANEDSHRNRPAPSPSLNDFAWLAGRWTGEIEVGKMEVVWSRPRAGLMMGMFRLVKDDQIAVLEFETLRDTSNGVEFRMRHFSNALEAWEEKDAPIILNLAACDGTECTFVNPVHDRPKRMILKREGSDKYSGRAEIIGTDGETRVIAVSMVRDREYVNGSIHKP